MKKIVEIEGHVFKEDGNVTEEEFYSKFITFIEANGWFFAGVTREQDE